MSDYLLESKVRSGLVRETASDKIDSANLQPARALTRVNNDRRATVTGYYGWKEAHRQIQ